MEKYTVPSEKKIFFHYFSEFPNLLQEIIDHKAFIWRENIFKQIYLIARTILKFGPIDDTMDYHNKDD